MARVSRPLSRGDELIQGLPIDLFRPLEITGAKNRILRDPNFHRRLSLIVSVSGIMLPIGLKGSFGYTIN